MQTTSTLNSKFMQVSLEWSLGNETILKMAAFIIRAIGSQKIRWTYVDDFFSLDEFDCFLYTYVLLLEPCFVDGPLARTSFARYNL
jgi:hypothetical protein